MKLQDFHTSIMEKPLPYVVFFNQLDANGKKVRSRFFETCDENRVNFYACNYCNYGRYSVYADTRIKAKERLYAYLLKRYEVEPLPAYKPFEGTQIGVFEPILNF